MQQTRDNFDICIVDNASTDGSVEYLKKYENIFDQRVYHSEIQSYAKQMFFASQAMRDEASEDVTGQNFVYDM